MQRRMGRDVRTVVAEMFLARGASTEVSIREGTTATPRGNDFVLLPIFSVVNCILFWRADELYRIVFFGQNAESALFTTEIILNYMLGKD